jgi:hypothetical protein
MESTPKPNRFLNKRASDAQLKTILQAQSEIQTNYNLMISNRSSTKLGKYFNGDAGPDADSNIQSSSPFSLKKLSSELSDEKLRQYLAIKRKPLFDEIGYPPLIHSAKFLRILAKKKVVYILLDIFRNPTYFIR